MKVFVVEGSAVIRVRLREVLQGIVGIEWVGEVDNETDAVQRICALQPDVVILDFTLANGNGWTVLRQIRMQPLSIRVIVLTNDVYPQYRRRCMELGADFFLDKSRDIELLVELLTRLAAGTVPQHE